MKKELLGALAFFDVFLGAMSLVNGIWYTFVSPWIGWGLIVFGLWQLCHFYYLLWGVEEVILMGEK